MMSMYVRTPLIVFLATCAIWWEMIGNMNKTHLSECLAHDEIKDHNVEKGSPSLYKDRSLYIRFLGSLSSKNKLPTIEE